MTIPRSDLSLDASQPERMKGPDLMDVRSRALRSRRHRVAAQGSTAIAAVVVAAMLTGSMNPDSNSTDTVVAAPAAAPSGASGDPGAWGGPACNAPNGASSKLIPAAAEIERLGSRKFPAKYTGFRPCSPPQRLVVFRMPDAQFDKALRNIGRTFKVELEIRDSAVSSDDLAKVGREVKARAKELRINGAKLTGIGTYPEGFVSIGVSDNLDAARRVLKDLDDLPYVEVLVRAGTQPA